MVTPSRRSRLVLVAGTLVTVMMVVYAIPALAQTGDAREDKVLAQVEEKEKPEQKRKTEEKGKLEEKGTAEQERVPRTGSILLGIAVGALLIGGGLLAHRRVSIGPAASSEEAGFVDVVRRVVLRPVGFFASLPRGGNLLTPLLFALICIEISAVLGWLLVLIGVGQSPGFIPIPKTSAFPPSSPLLRP